MKKKINIILLFVIFSTCISFCIKAQNVIIPVFDTILFYDGYAAVVDEPVPDGVIRHKNSLYATRMTEDQLSSFGDSITMLVVIKAACDNYDRIGNVNIAFVPKGAENYDPDEVDRIEIGRFITPFMNKNSSIIDTVPYYYEVNYLKHIFRDINLLEQYDFWMELEVFGVPYAAQEQVRGCSDRIDVFYGSLSFITSTPSVDMENDNILIPLFFKQNLNNYQEGASDVLGETVKSIEFSINQAVKQVKLFLITSNHGADSGGEEYNRRQHFVYFDNEEVLSYKPGRTSCEPFRKYNTQSNGIYGMFPKTDEQWQSFSNWCPGDVIDNRVIELRGLDPGNHTFRIEVPDAVFVGRKGNIPTSLFLMAKIGDAGVANVSYDYVKIFPNPATDIFHISGSMPVKNVQVYNAFGQIVFRGNNTDIDLGGFSKGIYSVSVELMNGYISRHKLIKQ